MVEIKINKEQIRFIIVGITNTLISYLIFVTCLLLFHLNMTYSLALAYFVGIINSYLWNRYWTFNTSAGSTIFTFIKFCFVYAITFLVNLAILRFFVGIVGLNNLIAQGIALVMTTIISYVGHKYWSFKTSKEVLN